MTPNKKTVFQNFLFNNKLQILALLILSFGLYLNSIFNEYALDDIVVITGNSFVQQGFEGIPDILTSDFFLGYENVENDLSGGRYRPFSLVVFAVEYAFFGKSPHISHFINVLLYCLLVLLLFRFFNRFIFKKKLLLAFLSTLIFCIHPIHTEVVANIKSRDEIIALLLLIISLHSIFNHVLIKRNIGYFLISLICFFLALLTKESAVTFLVIIPLLFYFFANKPIKLAALLSIPFLVVTCGYLFLRYRIVGFSTTEITEILNAPYLYASVSEAFATKVFVLGKYLLLLFFPHPMSYDYSYNEIPYVHLTDITFLISLIINTGLLIYALYTFKKRQLFSFAILYYFITISIVSNFVIDIGAPMADRLLFQPSIGFAIVSGYILMKLFEQNKIFASSLIVIIIVLSGFKTISRNADWKNNDTLFFKDVKTCPNSAKTNDNAGVSLLRMAKKETNSVKKQRLFEQAIAMSSKAIKIHPKYVGAHLNLGTIYFNINDKDNAARVWLRAKQLSPAHPKAKEFTEGLSGVYAKEGYAKYENGDIDGAIDYFIKALNLNKKNVDAWYNLGGNYLIKGDTSSAINAWENTLRLQPNHLNADTWLKKIKN